MKKNRLLNRTLSFGLALALFISSPASVYAGEMNDASVETIVENIDQGGASGEGESSGSDSTTASEGTNSETGSESKDSDQVSSDASTSENDSNSDEQVNKGETPESSDKTADDAEADADKKVDAEADANADKDAENDDEEITYDYESNNDGTHVKKWTDKDGVAHEETVDCEFGEDGKCVHCGYEKEEKQIEFVYNDDSIKVVVKLSNEDDLPEGAELSVEKVKVTEDIQEKVDEQAVAEQKAINNVAAYDIKFIKDGEEVEPKNTVSVEVSTPDVNEGDEAAVYHYDDTNDKVEDMNATVNNTGDVVFDTSHFSTYVIVNQGGSSVNIKINHLYKHTDDNGEEITETIYSSDEKTLVVGSILTDYNKAINWNVEKVEKVSNDESTDITESKDEIVVTADSEINVYYKPIESTYKGETTFYDYVVKPIKNVPSKWERDVYTWEENHRSRDRDNWQKKTAYECPSWWYNAGHLYSYSVRNQNHTTQTVTTEPSDFNDANAHWRVTEYKYNVADLDGSINADSNYANNGKPKLTVGHNGQTYSEQQHDDILVYTYTDSNGRTRTVKQHINMWDNYNQFAVYKGIVSGLDENGNVVFNVDQPGIFTDTANAGKTVIKDYQLGFTQVGDTYTLNEVYDDQNNVTCSNMDAFYPLDGCDSDVTDNAWGGHDYYYGMRYDVKFTLGDYVGPLNYSFTGDDDLWVILDGETVVIDLGGIHRAVSGECDLWDYIKDSVSGEYDKNEEHTLTILYMERGGNVSKCHMNFTVPNARIINNSTPQTSVSFTKVDANDEDSKLAGASFKLVSNQNSSLISNAVSDENGLVTFNNLTVGTYTLIETSAPDGYELSDETWTVVVSLDSNNNAVATIKDSDGNALENNIITNAKHEVVVNEPTVEKTASLVNWDDRTYQITLGATATKTTTVTQSNNSAVDVVLTLDVSGSMYFPKSLVYDCTKKYSQLNKKKTYYWIDDEDENGYIYILKYSYDYDSWITAHAAGIKTGYSNQWYYASWVLGNDRYNFYTSDGTTRIDDLKTSACNFIDTLASVNSKSRVAIVTFNDSGQCIMGLTELNADGVASLKKKINALSPTGGTNQYSGLNVATNLFSNADTKHQAIVLITDGIQESGSANSAIVSEAQRKATVYTVGMNMNYNESTQNKAVSLLTTLASKNDNGDSLYFNIGDDSLNSYLINIADEIVSSNTVGMPSTVVDIIDPRFELVSTELQGTYVDDNGVTQYVTGTVSGDRISWSVPTTNTFKASFYVKAKEDFMGGNIITTNSTGSGLNVINEDGTTISKEFPKPTVNVKLLDISLKDVETTVLKNDQITIADVTSVEDIISYLSGVECSYTDSSGTVHSSTNVFSTNSVKYDEKTKIYSYSYPGTTDIVGTLVFDGITGMNIKATETGDNKYSSESAITYNPIKYANRSKVGIVEPTQDEKADDSKTAQGTYKINVVDAGIYALKFGGSTKASLDGAEYTVYDENGKALGSFESKTVNNVKGIMLIEGLGLGTYTLKETKAPKGYALSSEEFEITIARRAESAVGYYTMTITKKINDSNSEVNISSINFDVIQITDEGLKGYFFDDGMAVDSIPDGYLLKADENDTTVALNQASNVAFKAYDAIAYTLPETGGSGVYVYTIGGILLMIAGALLLYKNKNNKSK